MLTTLMVRLDVYATETVLYFYDAGINTDPSIIILDENRKPEVGKPGTPRMTTRYRGVLNTPPATPKHRVQVGAKPLTPQTAARQVSNVSQTVYTQARQLFARGANPGRLVGRESEREKLESFIANHVESGTGGSLYVSGPPGTGKSAMVEEVCREFVDHHAGSAVVRVSHVNCVNMSNARHIYGKLDEDLCAGEDFQVSRKSESDRLKELFTTPRHTAHDHAPIISLVTLDEIDHLLASDSEIVQSLFEWSMDKGSHLILIGIANALDLTSRSLPQLKAKNLKPCLLPFLPYNAAQIAGVITGRLKSLLPDDTNVDAGFVPFVHPAAIQLCSKKVAAQTGDLRKAFDLVKRAIDAIEMETRQKLEAGNAKGNDSSGVLVENVNLSSRKEQPQQQQQSLLDIYTVTTAPRASIVHVARITSMAFGQGTVQRLQALNLQQKAAICALITLDKKRRTTTPSNTPSRTPTKNQHSAPTIKQVFDTYSTLCRSDNIIHPLTATEFKDVLSNLETMGLVGEYQGYRRGGTVSGGSDVRRPLFKSPSARERGMDERGMICFVSQQEIESQIGGPGENILRRLLKDGQ